jgi:hypothetical protein
MTYPPFVLMLLDSFTGSWRKVQLKKPQKNLIGGSGEVFVTDQIWMRRHELFQICFPGKTYVLHIKQKPLMSREKA